MKYTPGPWIVGGKYTVRTPSRSSDWICRTRDERHGHDDEEDEANAHLISAAPELYEACGRLIGSLGVMITDPDNDPDIQFARAAIAKAEGNGTA